MVRARISTLAVLLLVPVTAFVIAPCRRSACLVSKPLHVLMSPTSSSGGSTRSSLLPTNNTMTDGGGLVADLTRQHDELVASQAPEATSLTMQEEETTSSPASQVWNARWLLLGAAALYGTNFSLVKLMGESAMPVGLSSTLRFGLAALATSPWLLARSKDNPENDLPAAVAGFEVGMWNSIGYVSQAVGLETTLASKSAFLCSLAVVTVPLLDYLAGKRLKPREMVGAIVALAGVALLELGGVDASDLTSWTAGDWASLMQPLFFGMGFWRMERAMHRFPNQANRSTAAQLFAVFMGSAVYCAVAEPTSDLAAAAHWLQEPQILAFLFWTGVISTALTVYMETVALKTLSAAETTLILSTEPLWGSAFAAVMMGERFGIDAGIGAGLILVGCVYSNLGLKGIKEFMAKASLPADDTGKKLNGTRTGAAFLASLGLMGVVSDVTIGTNMLGQQVQEWMETVTDQIFPPML